MDKNIKSLDTSFFGHPKPLLSLSLTELWERFSFYGIRPLLYLFMIASFEKNGMNLKPEEASAIMGIFASCLYLAALPGGWFADNYLGQKNHAHKNDFVIKIRKRYTQMPKGYG